MPRENRGQADGTTEQVTAGTQTAEPLNLSANRPLGLSTCGTSQSRSFPVSSYTASGTWTSIAEEQRRLETFGARRGLGLDEYGGLIQQGTHCCREGAANNRRIIGYPFFGNPFAIRWIFWGDSYVFCAPSVCGRGCLPVLPPLQPSPCLLARPTYSAIRPILPTALDFSTRHFSHGIEPVTGSFPPRLRGRPSLASTLARAPCPVYGQISGA